MNKREQLLENCLARLAAGERVETCLAAYPEDAEWLRPYLTTTRQLNALSPQPPRPPADQAIRRQLRQAARHLASADRPNVSRPRPARIWFFMEVMMKNISRFLLKWLPRIAVSGAAIALLIIFVSQFATSLPFVSRPAIEPALTLPAESVTTTVDGVAITLEADLGAAPGEVPLYQAQPEPSPATPEEALAWAQEFGLPDPEVYQTKDERFASLHVLGSDGRQLRFPNYDGFAEIYYADPTAPTTGDPLPFAEAADIAIAFLHDHQALPDAYRAEPALGGNGPIQQVLIHRQLDTGALVAGDGPGILRVGVAPDGRVAFANLSRLKLEPAGTVTVTSAQAAWDDLLDNQNIMETTTYNQVGAEGSVRYYQPPPAAWKVGEAVDLVGYLNVLVNAMTGAPRVELHGPGQETYLLTGDALDELAAQDEWGSVRIQGTITAQESPVIWTVAVENWETILPSTNSCLTGTVIRDGETAQFRSEEGAVYGLPGAPEEIAPDEAVEICLAIPAEPGDDLVWQSLVTPPSGSGPPPSGVVTEQVVVEKSVEVASAPLVAAEDTSVESGAGVAEAVPLPAPTGLPAKPINPYQIGDEVTLTGIVQLYRVVNDADEEQLQAVFVHDGEEADRPYSLTYLLLTAPELLEEMTPYNELHIRVYGRIAAAPETPLGQMFAPPVGEQQAIAVDRFDRPWPDEKMALFLGHFSLEEIEGRQVMVFTDHEDGQQYVINPPDLPPEAYANDPILEEEQVLLAGIVHPTDRFGGLPLLSRRGTALDNRVKEATAVSELAEDYTDRLFPTIPRFNAAQMPPSGGLAGGLLPDDAVIERVELVYPYRPQPPTFNAANEPEPQLLEPVWAFYGRSADGRTQFLIHVRAVTP
ncbi:MAG: hypothetical protein HF973_06565 [Chloroflexi bacterium]|nr:hypothetical protein [Chloroflexota bacterium]